MNLIKKIVGLFDGTFEEKPKALPKTELYVYVRNKKREKIGVVLAVKRDGVIEFGWSKVNVKAGDKFVRDEALIIARQRLTPNFAGCISKAPFKVKDALVMMEDRSHRYFKI